MLAFSKTKCSKTLAFPVMYYEVYRSAMQSVELFCAYLKSNIAFVYTYLLFYKFLLCQAPLARVSLWTWLFFSIKNSQKVLHAQGFRQAHRYYPADDEICPRSERQVPAVSTASPWNQRNSFWISVISATEYPSFWQMDSICLFGIPVFGFLSSKYRIFDNNWAIEQNFEQLA